MARWNEVKTTKLSDYTKEQAKEKGKTFYKAWEENHKKEQKAKVKEVLKLMSEE